MVTLTTPRTLIAAALLIGASSLAQAETLWQCWRDQSLHVVCVLSQTAPLAANEALPPVLPPCAAPSRSPMQTQQPMPAVLQRSVFITIRRAALRHQQ